MFKKAARIEYEKHVLSKKNCPKNPFLLLREWWKEAIEGELPMVDAVYLSTSDQDGPDGRIVLLKHFDDKELVFYTNYKSKKAAQLAEDPRACLVIFWPQHERQVRIRGEIKKTAGAESDNYFQSRPRGAQLGAWASPQSEVLQSRKDLDMAFDEISREYEGKEIPRPPNWGGFRLIPNYFEFWQGRKNRLHDRICFHPAGASNWRKERLAP